MYNEQYWGLLVEIPKTEDGFYVTECGSQLYCQVNSDKPIVTMPVDTSVKGLYLIHPQGYSTSIPDLMVFDLAHELNMVNSPMNEFYMDYTRNIMVINFFTELMDYELCQHTKDILKLLWETNHTNLDELDGVDMVRISLRVGYHQSDILRTGTLRSHFDQNFNPKSQYERRLNSLLKRSPIMEGNCTNRVRVTVGGLFTGYMVKVGEEWEFVSKSVIGDIDIL